MGAAQTFNTPVALPGDPTAPLHAATKQYVDAHAGAPAATYQPVNVSPAAGATNVRGQPTLQGDVYYPLYGVPQDHREFEVYQAGALIQSLSAPAVSGVAATSVTASQLVVSTAYQWRYRDVTVKGDVGAWSTLTAFTTAASFGLQGVFTQLSPTNAGPSARFDAASCVLNGKLYIAGGFSNTTFTGLVDVWCYDPVPNSWTQLPVIPSARGGGGLAAVGNVLWFFGGRNVNSTTINVYYLDTRAASPTWVTAGSMPTAKSNGGYGTMPANSLYDIFFFCGATSASASTGAIACKTQTDNSWDNIAATGPVSSCMAYALADSGDGYAYGGAATAALSAAPVAQCYKISKTGVVAAVTVTNGPALSRAQIAQKDNVLYLFGGQTDSAGTSSNTLYKIDVTTNAATTVAIGATNRRGSCGGIINGKMYVFGGINASNTLLNDLWSIA